MPEKIPPEMNLPEKIAAPTSVRPGFWTIFKIWFLIGGQSFGGGPSTILLIRREFISKYGWVGEEEYARFWVLCQLTPGINLISLTILIGRKLAGIKGIVASMIGMLLPSVTITTLLAASFAAVQSWSPMQAMLRGVTPATAGISLLVAIQFARPLLKKASSEGRISLSLSLFIIVGCTALVGILKLPVIFVLVCAATMGAITFARIWAANKVKIEKEA